MRPQDVLKLAYFTRRFSRYGNPVQYRLARWLLKKVYPRDGHAPLRVVAPYSHGLININTLSMHEYEILFFHHLEPAISDLVERIVRPGDCCLDIGANIGGISLVMAHATGPAGKVFAVEPHPRMAKRLRANLDLNRMQQCEVIEAAVSDHEGKATLFCAPEDDFHQGWSSLKPSEKIPEEVQVNLIRGEGIGEKVGSLPLAFLKVDVEGHDYIVLKELAGIISRHRPHVVVEYGRKMWADHGSRVEDALQLFAGLDYETYYIKHDIIFPHAGTLPDSCDLFFVPTRPGR